MEILVLFGLVYLSFGVRNLCWIARACSNKKEETHADKE